MPVARGTYAPAVLWRELTPWDRYLARVHAVAAARPGCVFSHESAAVLLGLPVIGEPADVHVLAGPAATGGDRGGLRVHTTHDAREVLVADGISLTTAAECAVDIARSRHEAVGLSVADAALRTHPELSPEMLVARNEARASSRGRRRARWALHRATADAESTLESVSRAVIEWLGYPEPALQTVFDRDRSDFWWPDARTVGEADGDLKYDGRFGDASSLLRNRRLRDARLRQAGARRVAHWGWSDAVEYASLDGILSGAGLRRVRPMDTHRLATARAALRPRSPETARQHLGAETTG